MGITAAFAIASPLTISVFRPSDCDWCSPPSFDVSVRDAVHWHNVKLADTLSTVDAYGIAPIAGLTLLYFSDKDASWRRLIDDTLPVAESVAVAQFVTQVIKVSTARQRPYAHFATTATEATTEDNVSFVSGHSSLGFSITAAAGLICHERHYWTEPYVWGVGITASLTTEYLRMAADKHYLSDVLAGGLVGLGVGLSVPRLMHHHVVVVPTPADKGVAVVGMF